MLEEFQVFKSLLFRKRTEGSMRNEKLFLLMVDIAGTDPVDRTSLLRELFANLQYPCLIHNPPFYGTKHPASDFAPVSPDVSHLAFSCFRSTTFP